MITAAYCRTMARYNRWQNDSLYREADGLSDAERRKDRGSFFGSIQQTLGHILWGDSMWMSRFDGWTRPDLGIAQSGEYYSDWDALKAERQTADGKFLDWADRITDQELGGDFTWTSTMADVTRTDPFGLLVMHVFSHQTHHRGQVHAMLTAAGAKPDATDLPFMPSEI